MVGKAEEKGADARSVKKFRRSEPGQLLNLAVTKRTKGVGFNEVTNTVELLPPVLASKKIAKLLFLFLFPVLSLFLSLPFLLIYIYTHTEKKI